MIRVACVVGARPNLMKIAPLMAHMRKDERFEPLLIHTGQHYDAAMSDQFFAQLAIPEPDYHLGIGGGTHSEQTARVMLGLEPLLADLKPELVLVVGDVNSTLAAALVAAKLRLPLAHVEAGLRSFDRNMPEEINRVLTDAVSDFLFTTEAAANENLRREGVPAEKVFFVGNVMIDTLLRMRDRISGMNVPARFGVVPGEYALLTLHRPSNVDDPAVLDGILDALAEVQRLLPVLFPVHPRTKRQLENGFLARVAEMPNLRLLEPQGYLEFAGLMAEARLVMTDSGGVQEETTILGVPCLTLRENTERPVTVDAGTNRVVGTQPDAIMEAARRALELPRGIGVTPQFWDGRAAERIVSILAERLRK